MRDTKPETPIEVKQLAALITVRTARIYDLPGEGFYVAVVGPPTADHRGRDGRLHDSKKCHQNATILLL